MIPTIISESESKMVDDLTVGVEWTPRECEEEMLIEPGPGENKSPMSSTGRKDEFVTEVKTRSTTELKTRSIANKTDWFIP